jgi:glycosyltransferase involved in cell wall biosynthesis
VPPRVSVITPAKDAAATLPAMLDAIAALEPVNGGIELVVVDDGSSDATRAIAAAHPAVARVVDGGGGGPGRARNLGVAASTGDVIAFTDADCMPAPGWLAAALAVLDAGADIVQGSVVAAGPVGPWDRTVRVGRFSHLYETANLLIRRDWFEALNGFEPWLSPKRSKELGEDVWLGWRAQRAGARTAFAAEAVVAHAVFPGSPRSFVSEHFRRRFFPEMVARIPELRTTFCWRRLFLSRRGALFDLALAGVLLGALRRTPLALLAVVPYAREVRRAAGGSARVAVVQTSADAVGAAGLAVGSLRARSPLL